MKQSTKLLSLFLALVMCVSCFAVVGNATLQKGEVQYDSIDDAALSAEQVADILLDVVDKDLLGGNIADVDITVVKIRMDTVDHLLKDIYDTSDGFLWTVAKNLLGDAGNMKFGALKNVQRSGGDLNVIYALLQFLNDNRQIINKAVSGIGVSGGLSLGSIVNGLLDLDNINGYLGNNLAPMVRGLLYDALIYGSYAYDTNPTYSGKSWDEITGTKPFSSLDGMFNTALINLLTTPQDYTRVGEEKTWNTDAVILNADDVTKHFGSASGLASAVNINSNSILTILDNILQAALEEFGLPALNNSLKKVLMDAMGVDFVEIEDFETAVPAAYAAFTAVDPSTYENYIVHDLLWKTGSTYYYSDMKKQTIVDANGEPILDDDGNEQTERVRKFYKAVSGSGNEMFDLVNWDYHFTAADLKNASGETKDAKGMIAEYGSLFGCLNQLVYDILKVAINPAVANVDAIWAQGGNDQFNANLLSTAKFALKKYTALIFGKTSGYVDQATKQCTTEFASIVDSSDIVELIAYIGTPFFGDAMPQIILPHTVDANNVATYQFHDGVQIFEFGASVIRELLTDVAPAVNYDSYIYGSSLTSANGRQYVSHTADEWYNIILNMGLDLAYKYLYGYTNFNVAAPAADVAAARWEGMLNEVVMWAVNYVGNGSNSVLAGLEPSAFNAYSHPFDKLSYALNTVLPLGFINCAGAGADGTHSFALDVNALIGKIKAIASDFDIAGILDLLGRPSASYNLLKDKNAIAAVLDLVNRILGLVFGAGIIPEASLASLDSLLDIGRLKTVVENLLYCLNVRKAALLTNALPVVAKFVEDWGGEQKLGTPDITIAGTISTSGGNLASATFSFNNGSKGVWRSYINGEGARVQDNQYQYMLKAVRAYNFNGTASSYVSNFSFPANTKVDFGGSQTVTYKIANIPAAGAVVRFEVDYVVYDEEGNLMADGATFTTSVYSYLTYNGSNERIELLCTDKRDMKPYVYSPHYVNLRAGADTIPNLTTYKLENTSSGMFGGKRTGSLVVQGTETQSGITLTSWGTSSKSSSIQLDKETSDTAKKFTVNATAYDAAVAAGTIAAGSSFTWTVKGYGYASANNSSDSGNQNIVLRFYDGEYLSKLQSLVNSEAKKNRNEGAYFTSGPMYAGSVIETEPNAETGLVETNFATTGTDENGNEVTLIDAAQAWATYRSALEAAFRGARQVWNDNAVYTHEALYKALYTASRDVEYLKKAALDIEGDSIDDDVVALGVLVENANNISGGPQDYKSHRWERFITARTGARNIVNAYKAQDYTIPDATYFPYNRDLDNAKLTAIANQTPYASYILALREDYTEEQMTERVAALENAQELYAGITALDVSQAENMLNRNTARLIAANVDAELYFLNAEIQSAMAMIGATNTKGYTARSWARYATALANAQAINHSGTKNYAAFDAKYALLVARNGLRLEAQEADYTELEALIAQANGVLANTANYDNTNKDFGLVLAALGLEAVDDVKLFSGAAIDVNETSYDVEDQRKVDRAANALREALARLKFKNVAVNNTATEVIGETTNAQGDKVPVTAVTSHIAAKMTVDAVKSYFTSVAADDKIVSLNETYSIESDSASALTGTGSTITFYKNVSGVKIPVATVKLIVDGDVNGDGTIDALDVVKVELVSNAHGDLAGVYFIAGKLTSDSEVIDANDYQAVVTRALAA